MIDKQAAIMNTFSLPVYRHLLQ